MNLKVYPKSTKLIRQLFCVLRPHPMNTLQHTSKLSSFSNSSLAVRCRIQLIQSQTL